MSARAAARRLPGVQFESRPPGSPDVLPRMDVAAFVGFAAAGPLHTPVAVEDLATFADLFGDSVPLAWDRERGEVVRGNLAPTVRAFFQNGGARCWVVRVARTEPTSDDDHNWARSNHFPIPGLLRLSPNGSLRPVFAAARSEGSWSDRLNVGASLLVEAAAVDEVTWDAAGLLSLRLQSPDAVAPGDLLRLRWPGGAVLMTPVEKVENGVATLVDAQRVWLSPAPTLLDGWTAAWVPSRDAGEQALPPIAVGPAFNSEDAVDVTFSGIAPPLPGQTILLIRGDERVWLQITSIHGVEGVGSPPGRGTQVTGRWSRPTTSTPETLPTGLPTCDRLRIELWVREDGSHPQRLGDLGLAPGHPRYLGALPTDRRLFEPDEDLLSEGERALRTRVRAIAGDGTDLRSYHADLWQAAANPRFPLALDEAETDVFLPLAMPIAPDSFLGAEPILGDAPERDGLAVFEAQSFVDPALVDESVQSLQEQADHVRWQQPWPRRLLGIHAVLGLDEATLVAVPDAVHRGWSAEQVVPPASLPAPLLVAAAHASGNWQLDWNAVDAQARYVLEQSETPAFSAPSVILSAAGTTTYAVPAAPPGSQWFRVRAYLLHEGAASEMAYFVVGEHETAGSFWSDPVEVVTPPPQFADCPFAALEVPELVLATPPDGSGTYRLTWSAVAGALRYVAEESAALDFLDATSVFAGSGRELTIYGRAAGRAHYRVRAEGVEVPVSAPVLLDLDSALFEVTEAGTPRHLVLANAPGTLGDETVFDGESFTERFTAGSQRTATSAGFRYRLVRDESWPGPPSFRAFVPTVMGRWSPGLAVTVPAPSRRVLAPAASYAVVGKGVLLSVQAALVRLAAARGDLLALLGLPEHYRENDAIKHVTALRACLPETTAWSYAALYHPWLVAESDEGLRRAPPEGAVGGVMASRAAVRGAWIAPANQPLLAVLGLSPAIAREQRQRLYDAQVNLVQQEPRGFVVLSADTLSDDPDLVPIQVRRLLSLLRRTALRVGPSLVFEPNSALFRRTVERTFEDLLDRMYRAGAFAGDSATSAFQIAVDPSINTELSVDQGRFIVDLKVAPSLPMSFLTVRLVQDGSRGQVTEGL